MLHELAAELLERLSLGSGRLGSRATSQNLNPSKAGRVATLRNLLVVNVMPSQNGTTQDSVVWFSGTYVVKQDRRGNSHVALSALLLGLPMRSGATQLHPLTTDPAGRSVDRCAAVVLCAARSEQLHAPLRFGHPTCSAIISALITRLTFLSIRAYAMFLKC